MTNKIIFDLSKEYPLLARDEILSCLRAEEIQFEVESSTENTLIIRCNLSQIKIQYLANRLSMSFSIGRLLFTGSSSIPQIRNEAQNHPIEIKGSVAIRSKNRSKTLQSKPFVHAIADIYTQSERVDLTNPDNIIFLLITDDHVYVSQQIACINRGEFEKRKAHLRPFFSPISLHPKIARALVNISQIKPGDILLDPFCGTGGFLIEAGLMNLRVIGGDISDDMTTGTQKNLDYYKIKPFALFTADITEIPHQLPQPVDAVVTDFPYGKAASTKGERLQTLYKRAMSGIQQALKPGGRAVIGTFSNQLMQNNSSELNYLISYPLRVHRSLTRWFHVFERRP
jgi:tRNA (guanine10-N2)-dimethyltransferase